MIIAGAASTLAGLLAARPHTITTSLGILDVTTTVVDCDDDSVTLAMRWTTPRDEPRGLVLRLDDEDVSMGLYNSLFGDNNDIYELIASYMEADIRKLASDLTTYNPPHVDLDDIYCHLKSLDRGDLLPKVISSAKRCASAS